MAIGSVYRCLLEAARESGVDTAVVLAEFGLTEQSVLAPDARLDPEVGRGLAAALVRRAGDPELGLRAAERVRPADLDLFGYVLWHSDGLRALFEALARYARLVGDTAAVELACGDAELTLTIGRSGGRLFLPEAGDFAVGAIARLVREWSRGEASLREARLVRGRPRDPAPYQRFFGAPVRFEAEVGALVYRESPQPIVRADADSSLGALLRRQADRALSSLPPDASLVERARAHLGRQLDEGDAGIAHVAARLGLGERTLRRRLREAGTSYRQLVDDARRERALMLAHEGAYSVTTIAMRAGFSDVTAFARAFRRWTGALPSDYLLEARARAK